MVSHGERSRSGVVSPLEGLSAPHELHELLTAAPGDHGCQSEGAQSAGRQYGALRNLKWDNS